MSGVDSDDVTVSDLMRNFAEACRALVPRLNRARVPWADDRHYDNWDRIAEAMFETLVLEPCRFHAEAAVPDGTLRTARYGFLPNGENAFACMTDGAGVEYRFVQLLSLTSPFDHCEGVRDGHKLVLPIGTGNLSFVTTMPGGGRQQIKTVNLVF